MHGMLNGESKLIDILTWVNLLERFGRVIGFIRVFALQDVLQYVLSCIITVCIA